MNATAKVSKAPEPWSFRLPKTGTVDVWFGLSRSAWNLLVLPNQSNHYRPQVESRVHKQAGARHGVRLISFQSAKKFFEGLGNGFENEEVAS